MRPLTVAGDPRENATAEQYRARHDFLTQIYDELSGVDTWLNAIDRRLPVKWLRKTVM